MLFEVWSSAEAFAEFESGRRYMSDYLARVRELWAEPRDLTIWDPVA
jgi:quinol monooxygenase YgiN